MSTVKVLKPFYDELEKTNREPGDTFEAEPGRAAEIDAKIPGYIEVEEREPTIQELRALAKEKGVALPKGASKADIKELLEQ